MLNQGKERIKVINQTVLKCKKCEGGVSSTIYHQNKYQSTSMISQRVIMYDISTTIVGYRSRRSRSYCRISRYFFVVAKYQIATPQLSETVSQRPAGFRLFFPQFFHLIFKFSLQRAACIFFGFY